MVLEHYVLYFALSCKRNDTTRVKKLALCTEKENYVGKQSG